MRRDLSHASSGSPKKTAVVEYYDNRTDIVCNPRVIVEVLSDSTEEYDRLEKFSLYRAIPCFQEYLLIDQNRIQDDHYTKQAAKRWLLEDIDAEDQQIQMISLPFAISLADLYRKVTFAPAAAPSEAEVS